jgi:polar amino acid transport system substrate-binding protein
VIGGVLGLLAAPCAAQEARDGGVLTLLADAYCPLNCAPRDERPGYGIEIARRIFEPRGYELRYVEADWDGALRRVRRGEGDAVLGAFKSDAPDFIFPSEPVGRSNYCYFVREASPWSFEGMASLAGVRIGVIRAYSYGAALDRYIAQQGHGPRVYVAEGTAALDTLLAALARGEIDVLVEDGSVVAYKLRRETRHGRLREVACDGAASMYVAFSPAPSRAARSHRLARIWDEGLTVLRRSGQLGAIYRQYQ